MKLIGDFVRVPILKGESLIGIKVTSSSGAPASAKLFRYDDTGVRRVTLEEFESLLELKTLLPRLENKGVYLSVERTRAESIDVEFEFSMSKG